jgi:phage terminase large subunit-like protein
VIYGGAAGGGKSIGLLLDAMRHVGTAGWNGLVVRARSKDLTITGGLWDEARALYSDTGARFREGAALDVRWPSSAKMSFRHLDGQSYENFRGPGFAWIGLDEITEMRWDHVVFLLSRLRSTCGTAPTLRATCNPDPDHPIAGLISRWLLPTGEADRSQSGRVRWLLRSPKTDEFVVGDTREEAGELAGEDPGLAMSFTFIPSLLEDNPALERADPTYRSRLAMQGAVRRAQLEGGNWLVRPEVGGMFRRSRWGIVDDPLAPIIRRVRAWDKAASKPTRDYPDPDYTAGVLLAWDIHGRWYVEDFVAMRDEPPEVDALMRATAAADGPNVVQVIASGMGDDGKANRRHVRANLEASGSCGEIIGVRESKSKEVRASPAALELEMGMDGDRPREKPIIETEQGPDGVWAPRGFLLTRWMATPYKDGGDAPDTLGKLWWSTVGRFVDPKAHDDPVDALAHAHAVGTPKGSRRGGRSERRRKRAARRGRLLGS